MRFRPEEDEIILANIDANSFAIAAALTAAGFSRGAGSVRNRRLRLLDGPLGHGAIEGDDSAPAVSAAAFGRALRGRADRLAAKRRRAAARAAARRARARTWPQGLCNPYAEEPAPRNLHKDDEHVRNLLADPEHRRSVLWAAWAGRMLGRRAP